MRHLGLPPKISLRHDWMKELGSEVARQPEGEVARQAKSFQLPQPNPNPNHDRTGETRCLLTKTRLKHVSLVTARTSF